jgi:hypothetical protein
MDGKGVAQEAPAVEHGKSGCRSSTRWQEGASASQPLTLNFNMKARIINSLWIRILLWGRICVSLLKYILRFSSFEINLFESAERARQWLE